MMVSTTTQTLHHTIDSFVAFVRDHKTPPGSGPEVWGPHEVLAHLAFWHETYVSQIETMLSGKKASPLEGTGKEINVVAVEEYGGYTDEELISRLYRAQQKTERLAALPKSANLQIRLRKGAKPRSLDSFLSAVEAHIRNHELKLRRQLRNRASKGGN